MTANQKWRHQFQLWFDGKGSEATIARLLKRQKKLEIDPALIQKSLSTLHDYLDQHLLDVRLLPLSLLMRPTDWNPTTSGINPLACLHHHRHLHNLDELLSSGTLNRILKGECSLYGDIPPIPIRAYLTGLNREQRQFCKSNNLSALEHLATEGWYRFQLAKPVATGFDCYWSTELPKFAPLITQGNDVLLVLDGSLDRAKQLALQGGWDHVIHCQLSDLSTLWSDITDSKADRVSICHATDALAMGARHAITSVLQGASVETIVSSDDVILYRSQNDKKGYEHRQYRSGLSIWRLFTRGSIGGLLSVPRSLFRADALSNSYSCLEALRLDLLLGGMVTECDVRHCHQPLLKANSSSNPSLPEQGWPSECSPFDEDQLYQINAIREYHGQHQFVSGAAVRKNSDLPGSHDITYRADDDTLVSILIPFRDRVTLTRKCVESILTNASTSISYEIILIDNGSVEEDTHSWLKQITSTNKNIHHQRVDEPFNFSKLNNGARKLCRGNYLLFLNNDIELRSCDLLQELLNPFGHPQTAAVGSKLQYSDGSLQHQGVFLIKGERRCVLEPGKHLSEADVIASLLPLRTQEEFSAASAACLMVKAECFDNVGGFDDELAVVFNDVDLCLRLRKAGGRVVVSPHPNITHYESVSRGKDLFGEAWARHQRESGRLRLKHQLLYKSGDPLISPLLHRHSNRYEPAPLAEQPTGPAREQILYIWNRSQRRVHTRTPLIFAQFEENPEVPIRKDILTLLEQYRRHFYVQVVAATPALLQRPRDLRALKNVCDGLIIRRNEGYDYGSWMTGIRYCQQLIKERQQLVLCNDSFWGPVRPLKDLINRLRQCTADVIGLTDNLVYEPHLQSPFLMFNKRAISCPEFWDFWKNIQCWKNKRSIVKNYEVGLPVLLKEKGMELNSLYSTNANGNIYHSEWKSLIMNQNFPFLKRSLLRDNPHNIDISDWKSVVCGGNRKLVKQIENDLEKANQHLNQTIKN